MAMFIVSGLLGGVASALLWAKSWQDLKRYDVFRAVALGAIGGYLYYLMHSQWNAPDTVVAFFVGYSFKDLVEALAEKVKQMLLVQREER
jgi:4-amino-4-deoxy-L-arabinose transferase-like glycosyltransferase